MNRKAISPLLSTILLIVFAGILGGAVMTWGQATYVEKSAEAGCSIASLKVIDVGGRGGVCRGDGLTFLVQNTGEAVLSGLQFITIGKDINKLEYEHEIPSADVASGSVAAPEDIGKVIIVPRVAGSLCAGKTVEVENIGTC